MSGFISSGNVTLLHVGRNDAEVCSGERLWKDGGAVGVWCGDCGNGGDDGSGIAERRDISIQKPGLVHPQLNAREYVFFVNCWRCAPPYFYFHAIRGIIGEMNYTSHSLL